MNRPFDEAKYNALLKGLEAVEITLKDCLNVIDFRIDANTYKKDYLKTDEFIKSKKFDTINDLSISVQNFGAYSLCNFINFTDEGIPFLMTQNVRHNFIDWNIEKYVDQESHKMLYKSHCRKGQVLVTMAGEYLGRVAVYDKDFVSSSNQAIAKITLKKGISPYYISTFLNSKHGQNQINRLKTITGQPNINMGLIESLFVPTISNELMNGIEKLVLESEKLRNQSTEKYQQAENLLLEAVGLKDFEPSKEKVNIKSFKDSFLSTGRLDAEYYQPKFEQVVNHILKRKHERLTSLVKIKKSIEPGSSHYSDEGVPFLRVADYNKFGITEPNKKLSPEFCKANAKLIEKLKPKKETILFSKDGSVGTAYLLRKNLEMVTSGAVLHLTVKDKSEVLPEYLTLVLNSKLVQMQAERDAGGSIILHWRIEEIENVIVPIIEMPMQKEISELVEESFKLKKESENLLETAKRAVEIAIEETEDAAIEFINNKTERVQID